MNESFAAVFLASLLGSGHCVGMCGGLAMYCGGSGRSAISLSAYHLGRLLSYSCLGAVAGAAGATINSTIGLAGIQEAALLLSGGLLLLAGIAALRGRSLGLSGTAAAPRISALLHKGLSAPIIQTIGANGRAFGIGLLSAGLPCGWLWAFVIVAAGSGSIPYGALVMTAFWAGSVPALAAVGGLTALLRQWLHPLAPKITALLLIAAGLFSLFHHGSQLRPKGWMTSPMHHEH